ncbi:hypothetical protein [Rhodoblastus sp.]|uniref:hypothetical protein n=1 Tax=Rhodoblastus sp. TaxID=1962975 RepID=UPI00261D6D59|nr:hypothetical protein [Rhodoblastus sp.]
MRRALARRRPCPFEIAAGARFKRRAYFTLDRRKLALQTVAFVHGRAEFAQNIVVKSRESGQGIAAPILEKRLEPLGFGKAGFDAFAMAPLLFGASERPSANLTHNSVGLCAVLLGFRHD